MQNQSVEETPIPDLPVFNPILSSKPEAFADRRSLAEGYLVDEINVNQLVDLQAEDLEQLSPQDIFLNLPRLELEECSMILKRSSKEKFLRFVDYDVWRDDQFESELLLEWFDCLAIDDTHGHHVYEKFAGLDEEYQILFIKDYFSAIDFELYENLDPKTQDKFIPFPGHQIFYSIHAHSADEAEKVQKIFELLVGNNMAYMMNLLLNAHSNLRNEVELQLSQFRHARIQEDGFVTNEEAFETMIPHRSLHRKICQSRDLHKKTSADAKFSTDIEINLKNTEASFLKQALELLNVSEHETSLSLLSQFYHLSNAVCSALNISPEQREMTKNVVHHVEGMIHIGLELLTDQNIEQAVQALKSTHLKVIFKLGLAEVEYRQLYLIDAICALDQSLEGQKQKLVSLLKGSKHQGLYNAIEEIISADRFGLSLQQSILSFFYQFPLCFDIHQFDGEKIRFLALKNTEQLSLTSYVLEVIVLMHGKVGHLETVTFKSFQAKVQELDAKRLNDLNISETILKKIYTFFKGSLN